MAKITGETKYAAALGSHVFPIKFDASFFKEYFWAKLKSTLYVHPLYSKSAF